MQLQSYTLDTESGIMPDIPREDRFEEVGEGEGTILRISLRHWSQLSDSDSERITGRDRDGGER